MSERFPERFIVALSKENGVKLGFRFERPQGNFAEDKLFPHMQN